VSEPSRYSAMDPDAVWEAFFTVAPLVLVGTLEADGSPDIAPKHQATPLGMSGLFGFVCRPDHATLRNAVATGCFTVGYPSPAMVVQTSLAASPRDADGTKPTLDLMSLSPAHVVDGVLVDGCPAHLECRLERVVDDLDSDVLVVGRVVAAHVSDRARRGDGVDDAELIATAPVLAYLHPGRVASIHETKEFPYHRGFHR
jgi:flavin reductase (DIM6/NTAB) family NADH-FMN oxidoreductase RutF